MRMKHVIALAAVSLTIAACGSTPESETPTEAVAESPIPVEPEGGIGGGAGPPDTPIANTIPARFHGVWDYVQGTCDPASDMRMEISGTEIIYYESAGTITGTRTEGDAVIVTLAMEGEGETWQQETRFMLTGEGADQRLETSDGEGPRTVDEYPRKRCAA
jgi:hypothetical protein